MALALTTKANTFSAIAGSIASVAGSVTELFNAGTKSISMLDTAVDAASRKQKDRTVVELAEYRETIIMEAASREAETSIKVNEFRNKLETHKTLFDASYSKFSNLFAEPTN